MLKDIFIPMTGAPADSYALNIAIALAAAHDAHLTVAELVYLPPPVTGPWDLTPAVGLEEVHGSLRAKSQENAAKLRALLQKEAIAWEVRVVDALLTPPPEIAARMAHCADLTVLAGTAGSPAGDASAAAFFTALLFGSGRPVMVVPPRCKTAVPFRRVLVGWTATPHTARAIHDAMPLLLAAERAELLLIDAPAGDRAGAQDPGRDIANHVARHKVTTNLAMKESKGHPISQIMLEHAQKMQAGLIVVGGYGHSRLREWTMGGVTRELLSSSPLPVLYSH